MPSNVMQRFFLVILLIETGNWFLASFVMGKFLSPEAALQGNVNNSLEAIMTLGMWLEYYYSR